MFMKTQFELSIMSWKDLIHHYNVCVYAAKVCFEAEGTKLTKDEKEYLDYVYNLVLIHCENPAKQRPLSDTLQYYKQ
jgi:hypothetical protein